MITSKQLCKRFGEIKAIDHVTFDLPANDTIIIQGPSGSGKTTLLRLIAGLEMPDQGEIYIDGKLASNSEWCLAPHKRGLGFVFQTPSLWPHMTVTQNIIFGLHGLPKSVVRSRFDGIIERMSLIGLEQRFPSQLSEGQARRVSIARTLITHPKYLLMDEPLINMETELKVRLLTFIQEITRQEGTGMLYVTHDLSEAKCFSGRVLILREGRLETSYIEGSE